MQHFFLYFTLVAIARSTLQVHVARTARLTKRTRAWVLCCKQSHTDSTSSTRSAQWVRCDNNNNNKNDNNNNNNKNECHSNIIVDKLQGWYVIPVLLQVIVSKVKAPIRSNRFSPTLFVFFSSQLLHSYTVYTVQW